MTPTMIAFRPGIAGVDSSHPAVESAAEELLADLAAAREPVQHGDVPVGATKGIWQDLLVNLGPLGAAGAAVRVFQLWLGRDQRRELSLTRRQDGVPDVTVTLTGETVSDETMREALRELGIADRREDQPSDAAGDQAGRGQPDDDPNAAESD